MSTEQIHELQSTDEWDWYDQNLEDDGIIGDVIVAGTVLNLALALPADAVDPDLVIEVKEIEYRYTPPGMTSLRDTQDSDTITDQELHLAYGLFPFTETTIDSEAFRDELKAAVDIVSMLDQPAIVDDTQAVGAGALYQHRCKTVFFKDNPNKGQIFPLNVYCKFIPILGNSDGVLDESSHNFRIKYKLKRARLGFLGRILAISKQALSYIS